MYEGVRGGVGRPGGYGVNDSVLISF